jgi:hypothetical protein
MSGTTMIDSSPVIKSGFAIGFGAGSGGSTPEGQATCGVENITNHDIFHN